MKNLLTLTLFILLISCSKEKNFVEQFNAAVITADCPTLYGEVLKIDNNRNMVYVLDPTCSICLAEYVEFCAYAPYCKYDSLTTIVVNSTDMLMVDYYLEKAHLQSPMHENIIYDTDKTISNTLYSLSRGNNIMLFDNRKMIFSCSMQQYFNKKQL